MLLGNQASASSSTSSAEPSTSHAAALQSLQVQLQQLQAAQSTSHGQQVQEIDSNAGLVPAPFSIMAANQEVHQAHQANQAVEQRPASSSSSGTLTIPVTLNASNMGAVASSSNAVQPRYQVVARSGVSSSSATAGPSSVVDSTEGGTLGGHHSRVHSSNSLFQVVILLCSHLYSLFTPSKSESDVGNR